MPYVAYNNASRYKPASSRVIGIVVVVLLHLGLLYIIINLLGSRAIQLAAGPFQTKIIQEEKPKEVEPPPPPPKLDVAPPPFVPPPEISIETAPAPAPTAITTTTVKPTSPPAPPPPPAPPKVGKPARPDVAHIPNSESYYPPISKRLGEEGAIIVQVLVNTNGQVADCKVAKSSGYDRLDKAACELSRAGHFFPATDTDDKPLEAWTEFQVRFKLR